MKHDTRLWRQVVGTLHQLGEELMSPPVIAAVSSLEYLIPSPLPICAMLQELKLVVYKFQIVGFIFGAVTWLHNILIGETAPLRVIFDSISLLG